MNHQLKKLASSVNVEGKRIVVYNPLPWKRSGRVNFFAGVYQKNFKILGLKEVATGEVISVYEDYNLISFDAAAVPSMGYKTYIPLLEPVDIEGSLVMDEDDNLLENEYFRLQINDLEGSLSYVFDKRNNRELAGQNGDYGFGQYIFEQAGQDKIDAYNKAYIKPGAENWANDEMIRPAVPDKESMVYKGECIKISYLDMGNAVRATVLGKLDDPDSQRYMVSYTLYENQPYIEIVWGVDGKKPNSIPEAGWISFPFNVEKPDYRLYRTGGIVDPKREFVKGTNQDYYFLNTSMTLYDGSGKGMVLNCPSSPGISIDDPGLFRFSRNKELSTGKVFVNLFNTQWGTNFTEWIEGSFSSKIYIWSYEKYDSEKTFITPSEETRVPLKAVFYEGPKGEIPATAEGISLSRKGILLTAFKTNPDRDTMVLRLWEQAGKDGLCEVSLPEGSDYNRAYPCNLRDEITDERGIVISNNTFQFTIQANQPASFILK